MKDELIPAHGVVDFSLTEAEISKVDAKQARINIDRLCHGIKVANAASGYYRWLLGLQIVAIQEGKLWDRIPAPGIEPPKTFDDWLARHLRHFTGLKRHTGYNAMLVARSPAVRQIGAEGLKQINNISNVLELARTEAKEPHKITPDLIEKAKTMPVDEFRGEVRGWSDRGVVGTFSTDDKRQAEHLQVILSNLRKADWKALKKLAETIENIWPLCGNNPTDVVDFINSSCLLEIQQRRAEFVEGGKTHDIDWEDITDDKEPIEA